MILICILRLNMNNTKKAKLFLKDTMIYCINNGMNKSDSINYAMHEGMQYYPNINSLNLDDIYGSALYIIENQRKFK